MAISCGQIKDMSDRDLARYWSNYVKEIAVLLVSVEGDPQPPQEVVSRIQELVQKELLFLYIRYGKALNQSVSETSKQLCNHRQSWSCLFWVHVYFYTEAQRNTHNQGGQALSSGRSHLQVSSYPCLRCRAALTNMQSVKRFIAKAKIEEVRVTAGAVPATNRSAASQRL